MNIEQFAGIEKVGPKVLVDFSHLSHRNLFIAKVQSDKLSNNMLNTSIEIQNYDNILDDPLRSAALADIYYHLMFQSLVGIKKRFGVKAEDIVLCLDDRSWRKNRFKLYKAKRNEEREKSPLNWEEFYKTVNRLIKVINDNTKIKIIQTKEAEADDIIFVLAREFSYKNIPVNVVTSDKDIKQVLRFNGVNMFDPIKKEDVKNWNPKDLLVHILAGDEGDGVPSIKDGTSFSPEFLKHLKNNKILIEDVNIVTKLEIFDNVYNSFEGTKIFKPGQFAQGKAKKIVDDGSLRKELKLNPMFKEHFIRNRKLIDMRKIPKDIMERILHTYENISPKSNNLFELQDWMVEHKLKEAQKNISYIFN